MNQILNVLMYLAILAGAIYFLIKKPAANWILGSTVVVTLTVGSETVEFVYSRIIFVILLLSMASLFLKGGGERTPGEIISRFIHGKFKLFPITLLIVFMKIFMDTAQYGMDEMRFSFMKRSVYIVIIPVFITILSLVKNPVRKCLNDFIIGLCYYSSVVIILTLFTGLPDSQLLAGDVLSLGDIDTTNSGRFLYYGAVGYFMMAVLEENHKKKIFLVISLCILPLLFFAGARMYFVGYVILVFLSFMIFRKKTTPVVITMLILVSVYIVSQMDLIENIPFVEKISAHQLTQEYYFGRGLIWEAAFYLSLDNPNGVGFNNFNNYFQKSGVYTSVHGFFPEIMVEYGLILFFFAFSSFIYTIVVIFRKINRETYYYEAIFVMIFFAISIPNNFTDTFLIALGYQLFIVVPFLFQKEKINHYPAFDSSRQVI